MEISDRMKRRKGQWLVITALILSLTITTVVMMKSHAKDITDIGISRKNMFENIKSESNDAINIMLGENYTSSHLRTSLKTYIAFLKRYSAEHASNVSGFYIVGMPKDSGLNITVMNFLGNPMENLNISAGGKEALNLRIPDGNATTYQFQSMPDAYQFSYNFTYTDAGAPSARSSTFAAPKRVFAVLDLKMESENEILIYYKEN